MFPEERMEGVTLFVVLLFKIGSVLSICYTPSGQDRNAMNDASPGTYTPCDASANISMCCSVNDRCQGQGMASLSLLLSKTRL